MKDELLEGGKKSLCSHHPQVDFRREWGCPNCLVELREENQRLEAEVERLSESLDEKSHEYEQACQSWHYEQKQKLELRDEMKAILAEIKSSGIRHSLVYGKPEKFISWGQIESIFKAHGV